MHYKSESPHQQQYPPIKTQTMVNHSLSFLCFLSFLSFAVFLFAFTSAELCHPQDKAALLQIKQDFGNPRTLKTWTPETDCCADWFLVSCNNTNNRVYFLKVLYSHHVTGFISPAIGDLTYLTILAFSKLPKVTGTIPQSITKLTNLEFLDISYTGISGTIPEFLFEMNSLTTLILSGNKFTGPLPTSPNLLNLDLDLNNNLFTGTIPAIYASFKGVSVAGNKLTGTVPKVFEHGNFSTFDVSNNKLTGDPSFVFNNKNLFVIHLQGNDFTFDLSKVKYSVIFQEIEIQKNKIYGTIPTSFTKITGLRVFNVSYNNLCGKIPVGGNLQSFDTSVYFHNKCLCGAPLPAC
ncbi:hypothetical protein Droror1_Dr00009822 [Drosera rotundifolia]